MWADIGGGVQMQGEQSPRKDIWTWGTESTAGGPWVLDCFRGSSGLLGLITVLISLSQCRLLCESWPGSLVFYWWSSKSLTRSWRAINKPAGSHPVFLEFLVVGEGNQF